MIFTLGHTESYLSYIKDKQEQNDFAKKLGPREKLEYIDESGELVSNPYYGGIAFQTIQSALGWNEINGNKSWSVFCLDGNWDNDTYYLDESKEYRINKDLNIIGEAS